MKIENDMDMDMGHGIGREGEERVCDRCGGMYLFDDMRIVDGECVCSGCDFAGVREEFLNSVGLLE